MGEVRHNRCVLWRSSILGPGAVGTLLGGLLKLKGHEVSSRRTPPLARPRYALRLVLPGQLAPGAGCCAVQGQEEPGAGPRCRFSSPWGGSTCTPCAGRTSSDSSAGRRSRRILQLRPRGNGQARRARGEAEAVPDAHDRGEAAGRRRGACHGEAGHPLRTQPGPRTASSGTSQASASRPCPSPDARPYLNSLLVWQLLFLPVAMCNTTLDVFLSFPEGRELAAGFCRRRFRRHGKGRACPWHPSRSWTLASWPPDWRENPAPSKRTSGRPDRGYNSVLQSLTAGKADRGGPAEQADRGDRLSRGPPPHVELADTAEGEPRREPGLLPRPAELLRSLA